MAKKLTVAALKKQLDAISRQEVVDLVCRLYQKCPDASNMLNAEFNGAAFIKELLEKSKGQIRNEFFKTRGMSFPTLSKAKKPISEFKKASKDPKDAIEITLYYAECLAEFIAGNGDSPESFYDSLESVFGAVVKLLNKTDSEELFKTFYPRLEMVVNMAENFGYGLGPQLEDILDEDLNWNPEDGKLS